MFTMDSNLDGLIFHYFESIVLVANRKKLAGTISFFSE